MAIVEGPFQAIRSAPGRVPDIVMYDAGGTFLETRDVFSGLRVSSRNLGAVMPPGDHRISAVFGMLQQIWVVVSLDGGGARVYALDPHTLKTLGADNIPGGTNFFQSGSNQFTYHDTLGAVHTYSVNSRYELYNLGSFSSFPVDPVNIAFIDDDGNVQTGQSADRADVDLRNYVPSFDGNFWCYFRAGDVLCPPDRCTWPEDPDDPPPLRAAHVIVKVTPSGGYLGQQFILGYDVEDVGGRGNVDLTLVFAGRDQPFYWAGNGILMTGVPTRFVDAGYSPSIAFPSTKHTLSPGSAYTRRRRNEFMTFPLAPLPSCDDAEEGEDCCEEGEDCSRSIDRWVTAHTLNGFGARPVSTIVAWHSPSGLFRGYGWHYAGVLTSGDGLLRLAGSFSRSRFGFTTSLNATYVSAPIEDLGVTNFSVGPYINGPRFVRGSTVVGQPPWRQHRWLFEPQGYEPPEGAL